MCNCDLEYPKFYLERRRTAKATHECSECHQAILPKTEYIAISGKWDGEISTYKQCLSCNMISKHYQKTENCRVALGELFEAIANAEIRENTH